MKIIHKMHRPLNLLWPIIHENLPQYFTTGMCIAIQRMFGDEIISLEECLDLRREIEEDEFWAKEWNFKMFYWTPGDIQPRLDYLKIKMGKIIN